MTILIDRPIKKKMRTKLLQEEDEEADESFIGTLRGAVKIYGFFIQWSIQLAEDFSRSEIPIAADTSKKVLQQSNKMGDISVA